jgi:hypothetical protein
MALQAQKAEMEQMYGGGNTQKSEAYNAMAGSAQKGGASKDIYSKKYR